MSLITCRINRGHASYTADWLKALKDDKREIFRAAADAQRVVDMILGFHPDFTAQSRAEPVRITTAVMAPKAEFLIL